jgi:hypothetical protein
MSSCVLVRTTENLRRGTTAMQSDQHHIFLLHKRQDISEEKLLIFEKASV